MLKKALSLAVGILMILALAVGCTAAPVTDAPAAEPEVQAPADAEPQAPEEPQEAPAKEDITIAIVPKALDNPVFLDAKQGAEDAAAELGIKVEWVASTNSVASEQVTVIESLISKGVDGILISCNDADALKDVIDKAVDNGIVVATFGSDSIESKRLFCIGTDNYKLGEISSDKMKELLPDGGKVAVLTGVPGAPDLEPRIEAFKAGIEGTALEIVSIQAGNDDIQQSVDVVNQFTVANPDIDAWWFDGGWPFFADPEALSDLQAWREKGGIIVSVDTLYPMLGFVELDMVDYLVGQNFYAMGHDGVKLINDAINGNPPAEEIIDTGVELCDKSNYAELLAGKTPW